ncbi:MAG: type II toxin-antitoxin system RelE/ParE family toxin [Mesorhizobium sp.]
MKRLSVRWSKSAKSDLLDLIENIGHATGSIAVAIRYADRLEARCLRIGEVPLSGRPRDELAIGLRSTPFERSAIIFYVVEEDHVLILISNVFRRGRDYEAVFRSEAGAEDEEG